MRNGFYALLAATALTGMSLAPSPYMNVGRKLGRHGSTPRREPYPVDVDRTGPNAKRYGFDFAQGVTDLDDAPDNAVIPTPPLYDPREVHATNAAAARDRRKAKARKKRKKA